MKNKIFLPVLAFVLINGCAFCQDVGLSFSYFLPRNGYFSIPISPFSIRGVGFDINRFLALETGASLYRMSGLNMIDLPFDSKRPLVGPNFTIFVPMELVLQFKGKQAQFDVKGGGFLFYGFAQKLNEGNWDRAIRTFEGWDVANSDLTYKNNPGFGYHAGVELTFDMTKQFALSFEVNYLVGQAKFPVSGTYSGGTISGTNQTKTAPATFLDGKMDFTGLEISVGIIFSGGK